MMDKLILIAVALIVSAGAWYFWHVAQSEAFSIISLLAIMVLGADNYRLRKSLKSAKPASKSDKS